MIIDKVTISGADDKIVADELCQLQEIYPFVEWGILVSEKRMGESRYPTAKWIKGLPYRLSLSLHLCGNICRRFVDTANMDIVYDLNGEHWDRIQLNVAFKDEGVDYIKRLRKLAEVADQLENKAIIIPYNKVNKRIIDTWLGIAEIPDNIHFLYDSSGGRGRVISEIEKPLLNYTGYAGGIGPENIAETAQLITNSQWTDIVWIDMESGVRTLDEFHLKKVESVLLTMSEIQQSSRDK